MFNHNPSKSGTAILIALGMTASAAAPFAVPAPAAANSSSYQVSQRSPQPAQVSLPSGTLIPVGYEASDKIVVTPNETVPLTLRVLGNIATPSGTILIPARSQITGQLQPARGGSQFVAQRLMLPNGRWLVLDAASEVVTNVQEIKKGSDARSIIKGAVLGGVAAAAIALITGDRKVGGRDVLSGAGLGSLAGWYLSRKKVEVVVINPNTDLDLSLRSNLAMR